MPPKNHRNLPELPDSQAAEAALLGSMILDPHVIPEVGHVDDTMFAVPEHRVLVRLIRQVYERHKGKGIDGLIVRNELESSGQLKHAGGLEYLQCVLDSVPGAANADYYARIVRAKALRRAALTVAREISEAALSSPVDDESAILEAVTAPIAQLQANYLTAPSRVDMMSLLYDAFNALEKPLACRIPCPWPALAQHIGGFKPGQMIVICGRPSMGKTAFVLNLLRHACEDTAARVLFVSFEMDRMELAYRLMSTVANVHYWKFENADKELTRDDSNKLVDALPVIGQYRFEIYDRLRPTPLIVKNVCRAAHHKEPVDAIVVDYLQRMHCDEKRATRDWEMSIISNEMKNLARELHVPVFALAQLNREVERREDKRPRASDLRDSGTLEQDADVILGLYREDEYKRNDPSYKCTNLAEVLVLKQRNGPAHVTARLQFWPGTMSFYNRAADDDGQGSMF